MHRHGNEVGGPPCPRGADALARDTDQIQHRLQRTPWDMCHGEKSRAEAEQLGGRGTGILKRAVGVRRCLSSETFEQRPEGGEDDSQGDT